MVSGAVSASSAESLVQVEPAGTVKERGRHPAGAKTRRRFLTPRKPVILNPC